MKGWTGSFTMSKGHGPRLFPKVATVRKQFVTNNSVLSRAFDITWTMWHGLYDMESHKSKIFETMNKNCKILSFESIEMIPVIL